MITSGTIFTARSTSALVLKRLNEKRRLPRASSPKSPIALKTCDGLSEPVRQADFQLGEAAQLGPTVQLVDVRTGAAQQRAELVRRRLEHVVGRDAQA